MTPVRDGAEIEVHVLRRKVRERRPVLEELQSPSCSYSEFPITTNLA